MWCSCTTPSVSDSARIVCPAGDRYQKDHHEDGLPYAATADIIQLSKIGGERDTPRKPGESTEDYRARVQAALLDRQSFGTISGLTNRLLDLGYTVDIEEPNKSTPIWSRFVIRVLNWTGNPPDQMAFYRWVRRVKPAHTRAVIDCQIELATWDDWEDGVDEPKQLDEGTLDDWLPS